MSAISLLCVITASPIAPRRERVAPEELRVVVAAKQTEHRRWHVHRRRQLADSHPGWHDSGA
jgi:hypothetical protein